MTVATEVQHGRVTRLNIHELVRDLNRVLGPTLVAAATGSKDRKLPIKWAKDDGPRPGADFERRLRLMARTWSVVAEHEGAHVARAWFIGANPFLGERTPLSAVREDDAAQLGRAVQSFIDGTVDA
ncbi:hypothetical protein [Curtobacterium sp. SL109]|jgi:hypothetical protein|uniref:hypothetical protein n=1 Tax=Curtobacterium sp. SL109 TaxID=2994662 RepID=UPI002273597B|nr:hypothetical protein [Curtobacterium sp. SL109]MCY1692805.1 hypothetical protein [Curtobacterium sp. SL109]